MQKKAMIAPGDGREFIYADVEIDAPRADEIFVKIEAEEESELTRCIIQDIRNIPGISETRTLIGAEI